MRRAEKGEERGKERRGRGGRREGGERRREEGGRGERGETGEREGEERGREWREGGGRGCLPSNLVVLCMLPQC